MARTAQAVDTQQMLLGAIAEVVKQGVGGKFNDVTVERGGNVIVLPPGMTYKQGRDWLQRKENEEETVVNIYHDIACFPLDGAYAFHKAIEKTYGWTNAAGSFFNPNFSLSLETGVGETVQVLWGPVEIPSLDGVKLSTGMDTSRGVSKFVIRGEAKQKHKAAILALYTLTKKILKEESVYKGKAIRVDLAWMMDEDRALDPNNDQPKFMDLSGVNPDDLVFEATTERIIQTTLFAPIQRADAMRKYGIPLKRGVLLAGKYGVGKTMTANVVAKLAVQNGFTFIYLNEVSQIAEALRFAAQYAPAVIFAEDMDRVTSGDRTEQLNDILNTIDGVDTKGAEIITVLTTNHLERVNPAMLRPGRLDAVVPVNPPDAVAAAKLVRIYGRGLLSANFDFASVGKKLDGMIPAFIREVVERAKIAALLRLGDNIEGNIDAEDVLTAAEAMQAQISMVKTQDVDNRPDIEKLGAAIGAAIRGDGTTAPTLGLAMGIGGTNHR